VKITPLRDMLLVRLDPPVVRRGALVLVREVPRSTVPAVVEAVGGEVRDVIVGERVVVNTLLGTQVGGLLLIPESGVVAKC